MLYVQSETATHLEKYGATSGINKSFVRGDYDQMLDKQFGSHLAVFEERERTYQR